MKRKPFITKYVAVLLTMCMLLGDTSLIFASEDMAEEAMFTQSDAAYQDFTQPVDEVVVGGSEDFGMGNEETEGSQIENEEAADLFGEEEGFVNENPNISDDVEEEILDEPEMEEDKSQEEILFEQDIFEDESYEEEEESEDSELPQEELEEDVFGEVMADAQEAQGKVDLANLSYDFTTVDGAAVNTTASEKPKLLIFFQPGCWNCQAVMQMLRDKEEDLSGVEICAIEISEKTPEEIREFANTYGPQKIAYCSDNKAVWDYAKALGAENSITTPLTVMINQKNRIVYYSFGYQDTLIASIKQYLIPEDTPAQKYTITYQLNGGTNSEKNPSVYQPGENPVVLEEPVRDGYVFEGWHTDEAMTKRITEIAPGTTGDVTLYAKWKEREYTITYQLRGGKNNSANPASYFISSETIVLKPATGKGYAFVGWFSDEARKNKVTEIPKGSTGDIVLYAKWNPNRYRIVFNGNGATSGSMKALLGRKYGAKYTLPGNGFKKTNYVFAGWNTKANGSGKTYADKAVVKNLTAKNTGRVVLYAMWKRRVYSIKFMPNGGTGSMKTQACNYGTAYKLNKNTFKRKGYTFIGWNTRPGGKGKAYKNQQTVKNLTTKMNGVVKLYACWKKVRYTITYQLNGGKNASGNPAAYYVTTPTITFKNPTRKGYTFKGWYKDKAYKTRVKQIPKGSAGKVTLYAKWAVNKYKIVFDANGGMGSTKTMTCQYGKKYTLPMTGFIRPGYASIIWNTKPDGSGKQYIMGGEISNLSSKNGAKITLYADWVSYSYEELQLADYLIQGLNLKRQQWGLHTLSSTSENDILAGIAQQRGLEMAIYEYPENYRPNDAFYAELHTSVKYSARVLGEAIVLADLSDSIGDLIDVLAVEYKDVVLSSEFNKVGVAAVYYERTNKFYCVFEFSD